ncbi:MAG: LapA family protein [Oligoflexales bacterium]|nr:LapA family protein [Oligoflexales bacterium]
MLKLFVTILLCVAAVVFIIQNSAPVEVIFLFGSPVKIPLVFLLLIFFMVGYVLAYLLDLKKEVRLKRTIRKLKNRLNMAESGGAVVEDHVSR